MSEATKHSSNSFLTVIGLVFGLLLMFWLVGGLENSNEAIGSERAQERKSALEDIEQASSEQLSSYGVVSEANEIYQIPIDRAMEIIVDEWENPEAGREKLLARSKQAFPPPPAVTPAAQTPSIYE